MRTFFPSLIISLAAAFAVQALVVYGLGWTAVKDASNYWSSFNRLQAAMRPGAEMVVVGSSITGRLPGREAGNEAVANLGIDGASMRDGLAMLAEGIVPAAPLVAVEMNTLQAAVEQPLSALGKTAGGLWTAIGNAVPLLGAGARPTGVLYSAVMRRMRSDAGRRIDGESWIIPSPCVKHGDGKNKVMGEDRRIADELVRHIRALQDRGSSILLVSYPPGNVRPIFTERQEALVTFLSAATGAPYLDLVQALDGKPLEFTDGVHLGRDSAWEVLAATRRAAEPVSIRPTTD